MLPRSRHLPNGSTDGSLTENLNKIGVRLWTGCSFDEHREIERRDALDPFPQRLDGPARTNERRGAVSARLRPEHTARLRPLDFRSSA